jgi:hypothetical protein
MAAYLPVVHVCAEQSREAHSRECDYVHINGDDRTITVILANHCEKLPDDEPLVIRNMLEQF